MILEKERKITEKEIIEKIFNTSFSYIYHCELNSIKFYETRYTRLLQQLNLHYAHEPLKIFKKNMKNGKVRKNN